MVLFQVYFYQKISYLVEVKDKSLKIWDISSKKCTKTLNLEDSITSITKYSDSLNIIFGSSNGSIKLYDIETEEITTLNEYGQHITALAIFDENTLVSASNDECIKLWDLSKLECIVSLRGHEKEISCLIVNKITNQIFSGGIDGTVRCWDVEKCNCTATLELSQPVMCLDSDDDILVVGLQNGSISIRDLYTHLELRRIEVFTNSPVYCVVIDNEANIVCGGNKQAKLILF